MTTLLTDPMPATHRSNMSAADRLNPEELRKMHAYWRACCYLAAGMIYLRSNPLLREPLKVEQIKQRLLGHWGTSPALASATSISIA